MQKILPFILVLVALAAHAQLGSSRDGEVSYWDEWADIRMGVAGQRGDYPYVVVDTLNAQTLFFLPKRSSRPTCNTANNGLTIYNTSDHRQEVCENGLWQSKVSESYVNSQLGSLSIPRISRPTCNTSQRGKVVLEQADGRFYGCNGTAWVLFDGFIVLAVPNVATLPTCNAAARGQLVTFATDSELRHCNGTGWDRLARKNRAETISQPWKFDKGLRPERSSSDPATCNAEWEGREYYNTTTNEVRLCNDKDGTYNWDPIAQDADRYGFSNSIDDDDANSTVPSGRIVASNIRSGVTITGVAGGLAVRGDFTIPTATVGTPGASNRTITYDVPDGIYETGDDVSFTLPSDADLVVGNIKSGVTLFGVTGNYPTGDEPFSPDTDLDGFADGIDDADNDANIPSNRIMANNIRAGVAITGVSGDLVVRGDLTIPNATVGLPAATTRTVQHKIADGIYETGDSVYFDMPGDVDLIANNIRAGKTIFDVAGGLLVRDSFTIPSSTIGIPGASDRAITYNIPNGIYEAGDNVLLTMPGDADLVGSNIRAGKTIFGVAGTLTERGGITVPGDADFVAAKIQEGQEGQEVFGVTGTYTNYTTHTTLTFTGASSSVAYIEYVGTGAGTAANYVCATRHTRGFAVSYGTGTRDHSNNNIYVRQAGRDTYNSRYFVGYSSGTCSNCGNISVIINLTCGSLDNI